MGSRNFNTILFCAVSALVFWCSSNEAFNGDVTNLLTAKTTLGPSNVLINTWDTNKSICTWRGVTWAYRDGPTLNCSDLQVASNSSIPFDPNVVVTSILLGAAGLMGGLPKEFGYLASLTDLSLRENAITGPIPLEIGNSQSLNTLLLGRNNLNGTIPASLWNLCSQLQTLELDSNSLQGQLPIPANPGTVCPSLREVMLQNNQFDGPIPSFLGAFPALNEIDMSNNSFSGEIPAALTQLTNLTALDLSNNNLSGPIPTFKEQFDSSSFLNNPALCGPPLPTNCSSNSTSPVNNMTTASVPAPAYTPLSPEIQGGGKDGSHKGGGMSPKVVAGIIIGVLSFFVVSGSLLIFLTQARSKVTSEKQQRGVDFRRQFEDDDAAGEAGKIVHFEGGESLTAEDVLNATGEVLGKTSYGTVYKAKLANGFTIALRLLREGTARDRAEFVPAVQELGLIRHRNLVPLRAYYSGPKDEKLLVYDYMPKGSLADLLHTVSSNKPAPSWARRHKIMLGAARGLAYLHTGLNTPIIHGNLKSKNILVDDNYVAHLSDYGLEKLMIAAATNDVLSAASAQGYKAPELTKLKKANTKTDIYSFGIVMLEVLTGKKPGKSSDSEEVVDLPTLVKAAVLEEKTSEVFDFEVMRGLARSPADDGLLQALQLAMGCCAPTAAVRPDVGEVIRQLEEIRPKALSSMQSPLYTPDSGSTRSRDAFDY
ncbi:unnamed protein product [Calypogeia fissa]